MNIHPIHLSSKFKSGGSSSSDSSAAGGLCGTDRRLQAFTLLEVLIAMGIFFVSIFTILDLVSQNLRMARSLKLETVDVTSAISDLLLTNRLEEGTESGDFGDFAPGYIWSRNVMEVATNGLFRVDVTITRLDPPSETLTSLLLFKPDSQRRPGGFSGRGGLTTPGGR
jgi:Tfp pilus assembly protein PilV